jgi:hypothetical protein
MSIETFASKLTTMTHRPTQMSRSRESGSVVNFAHWLPPRQSPSSSDRADTIPRCDFEGLSDPAQTLNKRLDRSFSMSTELERRDVDHLPTGPNRHASRKPIPVVKKRVPHPFIPSLPIVMPETIILAFYIAMLARFPIGLSDRVYQPRRCHGDDLRPHVQPHSAGTERRPIDRAGLTRRGEVVSVLRDLLPSRDNVHRQEIEYAD